MTTRRLGFIMFVILITTKLDSKSSLCVVRRTPKIDILISAYFRDVKVLKINCQTS